MALVDSLHEQLCTLIAELMESASGRPVPRAHVSFLALGASEGQARELASMVNALFGLELPGDVALRSPTPDALARTIENAWEGDPAGLGELVGAIADAA
jgi:Phosphopantetheine attachment site